MTVIDSKIIKETYIKDFGVTFWQRLFQSVCFHMTDTKCKEADPIIIKAILESDKTDKERYEAKFFDCDDFAFRLMGKFHEDRGAAAMPIYITSITTPRGKHALLSFYHNNQIYLIEPQNDTIFSVPKSYKLNYICG